MNTNDEKIQWHPAFDAALQIEFGEEAEYLEFDSEHLLSKKPMQIDVLIKNEKHVKIQKNIGRIFRQYNIIEYKSPEDNLDIDDFYRCTHMPVFTRLIRRKLILSRQQS